MCGPRPSHSVASMSEDITPRPVLNAISFVVADMAATVEFYSQLGLEFDPDAANAPHAQATVAGMQIMFDTRAVVLSFMPDWYVPEGGHRAALAFECSSSAAVDAEHTRLVDLGYRSLLTPFDAVWGQRYAVILDPDDNPVDLYCALS